MAIDVFPWPPVFSIANEWTVDQPIFRTRSLMTGRDVTQASQRERIVATITVSSLGGVNRSGAGHCEMLKRALRGGINAVRVRSFPINWWMDTYCREQDPGMSETDLMEWRTPGDNGDDLLWRTPGDEGDDLLWLAGSSEFIADPPVNFWQNSQFRTEGLPPNVLVARAGDYVTFAPISGEPEQSGRLTRDVVTTGAGVGWLRVFPELTITGNSRVLFSDQEEAVFKVDGALPRAIQPVRGDWSYTWNLRQVFAEEVGGFNEITGGWWNG